MPDTPSETAWAELVLRLAESAVPWSCRNRTDREDIASETVARLLKYRFLGKTESELDHLARRIARTVWADMLRVRRRSREQPATGLENPAKSSSSPQIEFAQAVQIVDRLTPEQRQLLWLYFYDKLGVRGTASAMSLSVSTTRRRLSETIRTIRDAIAEQSAD